MIYLSAEGLSKSYPDKVLFDDIRLDVAKGEKIGLIASNGSGKSSLLKVLMGKDTADEGEVYLRPTIKTAYLSQDPEFDPYQTIQELIQSANSETLNVIKNYNRILEEQQDHYSDSLQTQLEKASTLMDQHKAWDYERRLTEMLSRFGIDDLDQNVDTLSGGQKKRLSMALVLMDNPEFLVMDEPTNHLDVELIEWLEKYLSQSNIALLMVTHDRYFLDRLCNMIIELEGGKLYTHKGNYSYFLEKKAERELAEEAEIHKAGQLMKKELDWIRRSPKARGTKSKSRVQAFYETKEKAGSGKKKEELNLDIKMSRVGGKILELKKIYKSYGDLEILKGFDHTFKKGERIGVVGKNGVGKSTFLNILTGLEQADSGKRNVGDNTVFGYYAQEGLQLKEDKKIIDVLKDYAEILTLSDGRKLTASQFLNYFLFPPKMQQTLFSKLSGGEKRRFHLLTVLIQNPNFLILDEPTNDLDLVTLNKLEEFLESFQGCLILVSHDRYFMDKLVDQLFVFEGGGEVKGFIGTYSEYREIVEEEQKEIVQKEKQEKAENSPAKTRTTNKPSYKDKLEFETLEKELITLEKEKKVLEANLNSGETDFEKLNSWTSKLGEVMTMLDEKEMRWMELDELLNN